MRFDNVSRLFPLLLLGLVCASCTETSLTDLEVKKQILTRSWTGEEFFLITASDSTFRGKDYVATFDFRNDGSYFFYRYSMSSLGRIGQWRLEDNGNRLSLSEDQGYSEVFAVRELTSTSLVLGDTNSRGYKLVPSSH
jgi:hypothetical protein